MSGSGNTLILFIRDWFVKTLGVDVGVDVPCRGVDVVDVGVLFRTSFRARIMRACSLFWISASECVDLHGQGRRRLLWPSSLFSDGSVASLHALRAVCCFLGFIPVVGPIRGLLPPFQGGLGGL